MIRQAPDGRRVADLLRWGLIPNWSKDEAIGAKLNNARGETVADKPSFRPAYKKRRCIVPAMGYYERQAVPGERKQPWFIHLKSDEPMAIGGLWESWTNPDGEIIRTFCVVTVGPGQHRQQPCAQHFGFAWRIAVTSQSVLQAINVEDGFHAVADPPAEHSMRVPVDDGRQIHEDMRQADGVLGEVVVDRPCAVFDIADILAPLKRS